MEINTRNITHMSRVLTKIAENELLLSFVIVEVPHIDISFNCRKKNVIIGEYFIIYAGFFVIIFTIPKNILYNFSIKS